MHLQPFFCTFAGINQLSEKMNTPKKKKTKPLSKKAAQIEQDYKKLKEMYMEQGGSQKKIDNYFELARKIREYQEKMFPQETYENTNTITLQ